MCLRVCLSIRARAPYAAAVPAYRHVRAKAQYTATLYERVTQIHTAIGELKNRYVFFFLLFLLKFIAIYRRTASQ